MVEGTTAAGGGRLSRTGDITAASAVLSGASERSRSSKFSLKMPLGKAYQIKSMLTLRKVKGEHAKTVLVRDK